MTPVERAALYVRKIPAAIEGSHGDDQTLAAANTLIWDFGLGRNEALSIFLDYNRRCSPPWTEKELVRKLQSAERQPHSKPRGNLLDQKSWRAPQPDRIERQQIDPVREVENFLRGFRCPDA